MSELHTAGCYTTSGVSGQQPLLIGTSVCAQQAMLISIATNVIGSVYISETLVAFTRHQTFQHTVVMEVRYIHHYSLFSPLFLGQSSSTPCLEIIGNQLISVSSNGQLVVHSNFELAVSFKNVTSFCSFLYFDLSCYAHRRTLPMCLSRFATKLRYAPFLPWQLSRRTAFCCLGGTPDKLSSWLSVIM